MFCLWITVFWLLIKAMPSGTCKSWEHRISAFKELISFSGSCSPKWGEKPAMAAKWRLDRRRAPRGDQKCLKWLKSGCRGPGASVGRENGMKWTLLTLGRVIAVQSADLINREAENSEGEEPVMLIFVLVLLLICFFCRFLVAVKQCLSTCRCLCTSGSQYQGTDKHYYHLPPCQTEPTATGSVLKNH